MIKRNALVLGLFFLAPLVGEFLLGNTPIVLLPAIIIYAPLYGGGALLIRELARRRGLGWPNMLLLATGYGVLEEGLLTQSLFNPNYVDQHLLDPGYIPALGIGVPWTLFVVGIHVFWSICAPILLMEGFAGERRTAPWLKRRGLIVVSILFVLGAAATAAVTQAMWPYSASPAQYAVTIVLVLALVAAGALIRFRPAAPTGTAPRPWVVFVTTLVTAGAFILIATVDAIPVWVGVAIAAAGIVAFLVATALFSARAGWGDAHRLAIGAAALLTYAWHSFVQNPVGGADLAVDLAGNVIFSAGAMVLLWFAYRRQARSVIES
ncbi:hypothetical protein [Dactylosporangium matsuzakiense]|uniref:Uncharacterized protein n=1 Tax=Dactylosporangium matsuzakiense TaxID=53360 RepID=A0A9W6KAW3_9ACTN|nr:hypothetical protein [Dactylosporangium matsuzakiense]UWZ45341.1 hypothetical protein Dmats_01940 [Dactylosporangium matsuzakiense]GLK98681.1 hypothetical protein GCM10017581_004220 [Dactylosporangium matsuzakiense]